MLCGNLSICFMSLQMVFSVPVHLKRSLPGSLQEKTRSLNAVEG